MPEPKKPKILVNQDLMSEFDTSKLYRHGPPIKEPERHDAGKPGDGRVEQQKQSHTLTDMTADIEFFTTALICTAGNFDRDPVVEFNRMNPTDVQAELPFAIDYNEAFFSGLGVGLLAGHPVNWDRRIYGIVRDRWELCRDMIGGIAIMGRENAFYAKLAFYEMQMPDLPAIKKMAVIDHVPYVPITVFAVSSNKAFSYLQPAEFPNLPSLVTEPPKDDVKIEGSRVLGPPPSPESLVQREEQR